MSKLLRLVTLCVLVETIFGQGRLVAPPGRSTMWRMGYDTPINYNDNVLSCGGTRHRWEVNQGKCGVCGDPWDQQPRGNEAGGHYATGVVSTAYTSGSIAEITVDVTNANYGYFEFRLCPNNNITKAVSEHCLELLPFEDKSTRHTDIQDGLNKVFVKLPDRLLCDQCVLQWKYNTGDHYGCETDVATGSELCGFGKGKLQTEYFACADIAIYPAERIHELEIEAQQAMDTTTSSTGTSKSNGTHVANKRIKRTLHYVVNERSPGVTLVRFPKRRMPMDIRFRPMSGAGYPEFAQNQDQWNWPRSGRIRRRVHIPENQQENMHNMNENMMMGGMRSRRPGRPQDRQVRLSFNMRRNNPFMNPFEGMQSGFEGMQPVPEPSLVRAEEPTVQSIPRHHQLSQQMQQTGQLLRKLDRRLQRNFIDPLNPEFGPEVNLHKLTQTVLSRQYAPTKQCQHCPFDQCLDDQLRIDSLFPGLFEEPRTFFECRKYEKLFTVGNYDIVKEGLPDCSHPRFKRQLMNRRLEDDDIGCCSTRPQVILPLTVDSENDTFNVVQLGNDKKQFIVQGICGRSNTTSCTVCSAESNFQWVLVYDPRVNTQPPVSFVPVKFPHYCRCYNFSRRRQTMSFVG